MTDYTDINVYFQGPELTPELGRVLRGVSFAHGYENSPLAAIMDGNGFAYDRFQVRNGILWAAADGLDSEYATEIISWFTKQAALYPGSSFMLVGYLPMTEEDEEEDRDPVAELIFNQGFDKANDPQGIL